MRGLPLCEYQEPETKDKNLNEKKPDPDWCTSDQSLSFPSRPALAESFALCLLPEKNSPSVVIVVR